MTSKRKIELQREALCIAEERIQRLLKRLHALKAGEYCTLCGRGTPTKKDREAAAMVFELDNDL